MTDRHRNRIGLGVLLLFVAGGSWWWLADESVVTSVDDGASGPQAQPLANEASPPDASPRLSGASSSPEALPPPGAPLSESAGQLQALADAGSSQAACRLAIELLRCRHLEAARNVRSWDGLPMDESLARRGELEAADRFAEIQIRQIRLREQCASVPPALLESAPRYLASAARAGEPEAMLRYATRAQDGGIFSHAFGRDPDFERWRREAPAMLMQALQAGRPEAVDLLASAYRHDSNPLSALFAVDPVQARAYQLLAARLRSRIASTDGLEQAADEARAQELAKAWHAEHFDNRSFSREDFPFNSLPSLDMPMRTPQDERFCERPPG